jgi:hypothetical protein
MLSKSSHGKKNMKNRRKVTLKSCYVIPVFLTLSCLMGTSNLKANELSNEDLDWFRLKRGFRNGHNFSSLIQSENSEWVFKRPAKGDSFNLNQRRHGVIAEYSYHIQTYQKFGFELGTSFGQSFATSANGQRAKLPLYTRLPGVLGGWVWNLDVKNRIRFHGEYGLESYDGASFLVGDTYQPSSFTMSFLSVKGQYDYFINQEWAMSIGYSSKISKFEKPKDIPRDLDSLLDAEFSSRSQSFVLGFGFYPI